MWTVDCGRRLFPPASPTAPPRAANACRKPQRCASHHEMIVQRASIKPQALPSKLSEHDTRPGVAAGPGARQRPSWACCGIEGRRRAGGLAGGLAGGRQELGQLRPQAAGLPLGPPTPPRAEGMRLPGGRPPAPRNVNGRINFLSSAPSVLRALQCSRASNQ